MKNNIVYILIAVSFLFTACKKQGVENIFDQLPEERMAERNLELRTRLTENKDGWKAFLRTSANGGGYGFYIKFNPDETLTMVSDWDDNSAVTAKNSTYSIRFIMNTSLIFDTYNYITILQDPQRSVNGGTQPNGLQSDIEFEYLSSSSDTVILRGKKYQNYLYLIKATSTEASAYNNGEYATAINNFRDYFLTRKNNFVLISNNGTDVKVAVSFDYGNKTIEVKGKVGEGAFVTQKGGYAYDLNGAYFISPLEIFGIKLIALKSEDDGSMIMIDDSGKEYLVVQNPVPLIEATEVFGYNKTYKVINIGTSLREGVISDFNTVWESTVGRFAALNPTRTIAYLRFSLTGATTATVALQSKTSTTTYAAGIATFNYIYDTETGIITLSGPSYDGNWTARASQLVDIQNYFLGGPFKVNWVESSNPNVPDLLGLYPVNNETKIFYGDPQ